MPSLSARRPAAWGAAGLALALAASPPAHGQDGGGVSGGPGPVGTADIIGTTIDSLTVTVVGTDDAERTASLKAEAQLRLGVVEGNPWDSLLIEQGVERVRQIPGVTSAEFSVVREINPRRLNLEVVVWVDGAAGKAAVPSARFPVIHRGERSYARVLLNAGFGVFSDGNPWFGNPEVFTLGNPLVQNPSIGADTGKRATWTEFYLEYGLAGVAPLGDTNLYAYGAATGTTAVSIGRDIFRDDTRSTTSVEKLYAGLLWTPETGRAVNLSVGRQNFTLNEGFLIAQYGSQFNAGPRPGIYLAPRTTHDMSVLLTAKTGKVNWTSFYLDPNEYEPLESDTALLGTNIKYDFTGSAAIDLTYINVVDSNTRFAVPVGDPVDRKGIQTVSGHLRWADRNLLPGVWVDGELAYQWHADDSMKAWAGYGLIGYYAQQVTWKPSISYRFSSHSGDDPDTERFERFDPLFTGGLGEWLQGITINKVLTPANRQSHRVRTNVAPNDRLNLTLDLFFHRANRLNNRGGNPALNELASIDLGREIQFASRWAISRRIYFVGVISHAIPGEAIRAATAPERAEPWSSFQTQFYFTF